SSARFSMGDIVDVFDSVNDVPEIRIIQSLTATSITLTTALGLSHQTANSAYVGREADGFYRPDVSYAYTPYDDAFVEVAAISDGAGPVPYKPKTELDTAANRAAFSAIWFKNGKVSRNLTNYVHVIGCERVLFGTPAIDTWFGLSNEAVNASYVAVQAVEAFYSSHRSSGRY